MPPNCSRSGKKRRVFHSAKAKTTQVKERAAEPALQTQSYNNSRFCDGDVLFPFDSLPAKSYISVLGLHLNGQAEFSADHCRLIAIGLHCGQTLVHTLRRKTRLTHTGTQVMKSKLKKDQLEPSVGK